MDNDNFGYANEEKLIPEWGETAENQILWLGLGICALLAFLWGWAQFGDDDPIATDVGAIVINAPDVEPVKELDAAVPTTVAVATETLTNNLPETMKAFGVTGEADGENGILTGFVGTENESAAAELAATKEPGITTVSNRLVVLTPLVQSALGDAGVGGFEAAGATMRNAVARGYVDNAAHKERALAAVAGVGGVEGVDDQLVMVDVEAQKAIEALGVQGAMATSEGLFVTVSGTVADLDAKEAALSAALVPGVIEVIDEITIDEAAEPAPAAGTDVVAELNALFEANPIQFNSGSADIKAESFPILDQAAELLGTIEDRVQIQGYTDTSGGDAFNQTLSENRAAAVLDYMVSKGIGAAQMESKGFGETTQFGDDLAPNRRVRFELL